MISRIPLGSRLSGVTIEGNTSEQQLEVATWGNHMGQQLGVVAWGNDLHN